MTAGRLAAPLATSALFAGSFVAAKWASFELGPLSATLLRYTVALAFLLLLAWFRDPAAITAPNMPCRPLSASARRHGSRSPCSC